MARQGEPQQRAEGGKRRRREQPAAAETQEASAGVKRHKGTHGAVNGRDRARDADRTTAAAG